MRRGNGSLRLSASLYCAARDQRICVPCIFIGDYGGGPAGSGQCRLCRNGRRQIEDAQSEGQPGAIRSGRILFRFRPNQAGHGRFGPDREPRSRARVDAQRLDSPDAGRRGQADLQGSHHADGRLRGRQ